MCKRDFGTKLNNQGYEHQAQDKWNAYILENKNLFPLPEHSRFIFADRSTLFTSGRRLG